MTPMEYRETHPDCSYCPYLRTYHSSHWHPRGRVLELDHIWGRKGPCDVVSNWIMACPHCHDLKTVGMQKLARIAAMHYKLTHREVDLQEIKQCSGYDLTGWLEKEKSQLNLPGHWGGLLDHCITLSRRLVDS